MTAQAAPAPLGKVKAILAKAFPGIRFTSGVRSRAEQDALVKAGKTRAVNSQHVTGTGLDMVLPDGVSSKAVRSALVANGIEPSELLNESGSGRNQGTGAHLHVGWAPKRAGTPKPEGGDPNSGGGSTYDRVMAKRAAEQDAGPSIEKVFQAYKQGRMEPQEAAQFEHDVNEGHVMLPRGAALKKTPAAFALPKGVIDAYNSHAMSDEDRAQVDTDLRDGVVSLPRGVQLKAPPPRTDAEMFGMGVRGVGTGAGGVLDMVAGPVNRIINALPGEQGMSPTPFRDLANAGADAIGLASPESSSEQFGNAVVEGGTAGLATAGAALPVASAAGTTGAVARALSSSPILDTVSGAASGASSEVARQSGAGPVGQLLAGVAGGGATVGGAMAAERGAARLAGRAPRTVEEVVATKPREEVFDGAGNLTEEGRETATRIGATTDELRAGYDAPPNVKSATANDRAVPREAVAKTADEGLPLNTVEEAPPVRVVDAPEHPAQPQEAAPVAPPADAPLPATAKARFDEAASEDITLSRGQATQDFATQDAEQTLRAQASGEGEKARTFVGEQVDKIKAAVERFSGTFGDTDSTATARGQVVKDALRELREEGRKGVQALYEAAAKTPGHDIPLENAGILQEADKVILETPMDQGSKDALERALAKFGLLGDEVEAAGRYRSVVTDDGRKIRILGEVEPLTLANAETFRQALNAAWDNKGLMGRVVRALDETVDAVLEKTASAERNDLFKEARAAARTQKQTFEAKDVVQNLIDWKKGTKTDVVLPEKAIAKIFEGGKEGVTNLKKVKALLLSKPTEASRAAWRAIQAHGVADIFAQAYTVNANVGGGSLGAVSGAKLNTAITKFGADKLKVLLEDGEFNQLMKLRRIIGDATIPISGTTNPSGSAFKMMRFLGPIAGRLVPFGGQIADTVGGLIKQGKEVAQAQKTLKGVTEYTAEQAADEVVKSPDTQNALLQKADQAANAFIKSFIEIAGSERLIAPILASGSNASGDKE